MAQCSIYSMLLKFICDDLVHVNTPVTAVKMIEKGERFGEHEDEIECGLMMIMWMG